MRNLLICLFSLCSAAGNLFGQSDPVNIIQPGDVSLRIKSVNFIKDNEYYNPVTEGYTLLGFFFQPELLYTASGKLTLRAGTHILKYYGADDFSQIRPVFSTTLNFSENTSLTLGTLNGSDKHRFFDPHFHSERAYNEYVEDGIQLTSMNKSFFTDTWVSWENYIFKGDSTQEQFTFGESFRYSSSPIAGFIHIEVPVQVQLKHRGGQISDYNEGVESIINIAAGLRVNFDLAKKKYGQAGIEYLQFGNKLQKGDSISGITGGYASWFRLHYSFKALRLETGYWTAHDFYSPNGNPIYGSVSDYQPGVVIHNRRIINNSIHLRFLPANSLELFLGVDLYYDIDLKRVDQAYGVHLNFDKLFYLASSKRRSKSKPE